MTSLSEGKKLEVKSYPAFVTHETVTKNNKHIISDCLPIQNLGACLRDFHVCSAWVEVTKSENEKKLLL